MLGTERRGKRGEPRTSLQRKVVRSEEDAMGRPGQPRAREQNRTPARLDTHSKRIKGPTVSFKTISTLNSHIMYQFYLSQAGKNKN